MFKVLIVTRTVYSSGVAMNTIIAEFTTADEAKYAAKVINEAGDYDLFTKQAATLLFPVLK